VIDENPRITPLEIAKKLSMSAQYVRNVLAILLELGLVETPARGVYITTNLGKFILKEITKEEK